jgi:proline iminopeptidase
LIVTGGSWGSTLALVYAIRHPDRVLGLHVAAVCLLRKSEIDWLFKEGGASCMNPKYWKEFKEHIPESERDNLVKAYYSRITSSDEKIRDEACKIWAIWESSMVLFNNKYFDKDKLVIKKLIPQASIECHFFLNNTLFEENYILNNIDKIQNIPLYISQGQYDIVCPIKAAMDLHEAVPKSILTVVNNAGHNRFEEPFKTTYIDNMNKLIDQVSNLSSPSL